jgi:hypothetical protein
MGITGQDIVMETRLGTPNLNVNELLVRSMYWSKSASVWLTNAQPLRGMIYLDHFAHMHSSLFVFRWGCRSWASASAPFRCRPLSRPGTSPPRSYREPGSSRRTRVWLASSLTRLTSRRRSRQVRDHGLNRLHYAQQGRLQGSLSLIGLGPLYMYNMGLLHLAVSISCRDPYGVGLRGSRLRAGPGRCCGGPCRDGHHHEGTWDACLQPPHVLF